MKKSKRNLYKKAHIYNLIEDIYDVFPLFVLPLLQNLLYNPTSLPAIITNFGLSIVCVILIFTAIILEYRSVLYLEKENSVYTKKGFFLKKRADIPYPCIQSVYINKNIIPRLFGARKYFINTPGSFTAKGDYELYLRRQNSLALTENIFGKENKTIRYNGGFLRIILMSATWSNALTGLLISIPLLYRTSSAIGEIFRDYFMEKFDIASYIVKIGVPPALSGLATILVISWGIAYLTQLMRYSFFTAKIGNNIIHIARGFINRADFYTTKDKLNAIQIKQSVLMLVLNLKSAYISVIGSGVQKGDRSLLIPADREENINKVLSHITTLPREENYKVKARKTEFMSYLWFPFYSILGTIAGIVILNYFGFFGEIVRMPVFTLLGIFVYWLFFRMYAFTKSSITACNEAVMIDYFKKLNITRTYIPYNKIQYIKVYQSPWQRLSKTANLRIYVYSNKEKYYKIKYLKYKTVMEIVDIIESNMRYGNLKV